ncbi:MAG: phytanoyl-CoA dioxygenase family protein [Pseudomonadales bacterium]|jgi:ectoine hydroxylase-related dioxygenase (phytanoyl-CoA dioxygenase family)|nr:phytanoyl-CoA dioxygenase family protein [Pseudomonadales bacterium]
MNDISAHLSRIESEGYTLIENAIEPALVDELNDALLELEHALNIVPGANTFEGHHTIRVYNLLAQHAVFQKVPVHPALLPIVESVLDEGCLVSSVSSVSIDPGETAQPLHADDTLYNLTRPHDAVVCNSMWALTDFTEENGATRIVPGSHRFPDKPEYGKHYDSIAAEMPKGSLLIWNGSLWHGGGANDSGSRRVGIAMNYCAGFLRQQENQQLGIPLEKVATFSDRLLQLAGFGTYKALIGHIDKQSPTRVLLDREDNFLNVWDLVGKES